MDKGTQKSRREFLQAAGPVVAAGMTGAAMPAFRAEKDAAPLKVCLFSKHLHFLGCSEMADAAREIGFDGIDLTVRSGGHVLPERVEQDLPRAVDIIRKAGLLVPMVTTGIVDTHSPYVESMLRTFHAVGIPRYRWGGFKWEEPKSMPERLEELKQESARLADMNRKHQVCAMYHNHSGTEVGASVWDLWYILKDLDRAALGVNYDSAHGTIEGGLGGWLAGLRLVSPMLKGIAVKDFRWARNAKGAWIPEWCPLGEGMVNFGRFFSMIREARFSGPVQVHFEYPLGGAEKGDKTIAIEKSRVFAAMRKDLATLRGWLKEARLA